jgi:DNA-binding transcriptional LysR family regulator
VRSRINANNGDVLTEAAAQGLGITLQPDFIADSFCQWPCRADSG